MNLIYRFQPYIKRVIWGGHVLAALKHVESADGSHIGESWELSSIQGMESVVIGSTDDDGLTLTQLIDKYKGRLVGDGVYAAFGNTFPVLVKFINAERDLSVQVHPDDATAKQRHCCPGKAEMWYVMDATEDAGLYAGLSRKSSKEEILASIADNSLLDLISYYKTAKGDVFFLPPGCVHTIGGGNTLVEIQQPSDITYRLYDYNRRDENGSLRKLHLDEALGSIDYDGHASPALLMKKPYDGSRLVTCDYFVVDYLNAEGQIELPLYDGRFTIVVCTEGEGELIAGDETIRLSAGFSALIAASAPSARFNGTATILTASTGI